MEDHLFYQNLEFFSDFNCITNESYFSTVPSSWLLVIADIKNSTEAIEQGKYKEVNTVGAAVIACVQKVIGELQIPFSFDGDFWIALALKALKSQMKLSD